MIYSCITLSSVILSPVPIWDTGTHALDAVLAMVGGCSGTRCVLLKLYMMVKPASHDNRAHIFTTIVCMCGRVNEIVANTSSHTSFLSQYMDFAYALTPLSLG